MDSPDPTFLEEARRKILSHLQDRREAGLYDTIVSVVRAQSGSLYAGIPFETDQAQFDCCAERHALNNLRFAEPGVSTFDALLVAGAVPDVEAGVTTPCGACRQAMYAMAPDATVYCSNFVREADGWTMFPSLEQYPVGDLFPHHTPLPTWD